ncbi:MAG: hypothetical protein ACOYJ1_16215, partial [Peptococcales bacterium]|jgi:hypothetical protein
MVGELDKELVKISPQYTVFVNALNGSAMLINLDKVDNTWVDTVEKIAGKFQTNILGSKDFKYPGLNVIRDRLFKAFDPNNISFFGGERV